MKKFYLNKKIFYVNNIWRYWRNKENNENVKVIVMNLLFNIFMLTIIRLYYTIKLIQNLY